MLDENELLFDELYEKTKNCSRVQFINLLMEKEKEIKKLEEEYQIIDSKLFFTKYELDMRQKSIDNKLSQQKEFIEYLKSEIKNSDICDVYVHGMKFNSAEKMIYKDILSKYKEIIGGLDEQ